jgi:hypothetical protein
LISTVTGVLNTVSGFAGKFGGLPTGTYILQVSTNLVNWTSVSTNFVTSGSLPFTDVSAASRPAGYYRVVTP